MVIEKIMQFVKKYWYLLLLPIVFPISISQVIRIPLGNWTIGDGNAWVSFFGSYLGGIVGGIITLFVFKKTIEKQEEMQKSLKNEQDEIRKLSMKPYLTARLTRANDNIEYVFELDYLPLIEDISSCERMIVYVRLENVGMGNAVGISFYADEGYYTNFDLDPLTIRVGTAMSLRLQIVSFAHEDKFEIKIRLTDLLGNAYNQIVKFAKIQGDISVLSISEPVPIIEFRAGKD
jgi:hypothetical protein